LAVLPEAAAFLDEFVDDLVPEGRVVREQDGHGHFDMRGGVLNPARLNELFDRIEQDQGKCYYPCSCDRREWLDMVLPRADEIWLFLDPEGDPEDARHAIASFVNTPAWETSKKVLVFLHQTLKHTKGTKHWLDALKPDQHFHIRVSEATDKARLKRYLLDQSLGLVLGGGGARGFAHIGIVKAFDSAGLKFDWFGGTSIGAVMAAWLGQGLAPDEIVPAIRKFFVDVNPLGDYTLPLVSLSRSARLDRLLKEGMGLGDIEDMPLPFFCISSDLSVAEERVHQRGALWRAVRASIAIPGVIAPVIQDNHFLVDGALLNNLPVDHMASFNSGPVIAIDVSDHEPLLTDEVYVPSFAEYVWRKVRGKTPRIPTILETLSRSTTLASSSRANKNKSAADFYLKPDLTQFGSLEFKSAEVIIEAGYQAGMRALDKELVGIKNLSNGKGFA
jgi:predicted acylesterase/phospholipase RssA